jgi:hypothetical protein
MRKTENIYDVNSPEIQSLLLGVYRSGPRSYHRLDADGKHDIVPIRKQLIALGMCSKTATRVLREADLPYEPFVRSEMQPAAEPEPDPQAMMQAALQAAAREREREEKRAKAAKAEAASIRKKYSLVRQGSYHGVYNEDTGTQVLFHSIEEAREHLSDLIHGKDSFKIYYGATGRKHYQQELQLVG